MKKEELEYELIVAQRKYENVVERLDYLNEEASELEHEIVRLNRLIKEAV